MSKTIILIHGRSPKPTKKALKEIWIEALRFGVERDHPEKLTDFDAAQIEFVYYGDINNEFLVPEGYDVENDAKGRRKTLSELKEFSQEDFYEEKIYNALPGKCSIFEFLASTLGSLLSLVGVGEPLVYLVAPDMKEYWNSETTFGSDVRYPMIKPLKDAMDRNDKIMVIAHSLGSLIAYDTFWKFSRMGEYRPQYTDKKVDLFISIGSPLSDETVKRHLKGSDTSGERRYPASIVEWVNVTAEDDFLTYDSRVANDFKEMIENNLIHSINDHRILNLSIRKHKSNPHHASGYLIHPFLAKMVADWL